MLLRRFIRYLSGYVRVVCTGGNPGKLLDLALKEGLNLFAVSEHKGKVRFCMPAREYRRMPTIAKRSKCRVRLSGKRGLYFSVRRIPNKTPLVLGIAVFCVVFLVCGSMTFMVEFRGDSTISKSDIAESLARQGIYPGAFQNRIDLKQARQRVLLENERLSWMAINLSFGRAVIELKDKESIPNQDIGQPQISLMSRYDAVVVSVDITAGTALVQPGDVVSKGQMLAKPNEIIPEGSWVSNVRGSVVGTVDETISFPVAKRQVQRVPTGRKVTEYIPALTFREFPDKIGQNAPYRWFDVQCYRQPLTLFSVPLPVYLACADYFEIEQRSYWIGEQQAWNLAQSMCRDYENEQMTQAEILSRDIAIHDDGDAYRVDVRYLFRTEISRPMPMEPYLMESP